MNRTLKDGTDRRYSYDSHDQLRQHLADSVSAYNFARRLSGRKRHLVGDTQGLILHALVTRPMCMTVARRKPCWRS